MTRRLHETFLSKFGDGFSHHHTSLLCQSPPKTRSTSPSPSMSCEAPPASTVKKSFSITYRSQPVAVRRYHTSAGATLRKLNTKSFTPSLSRSATSDPVCCVDSPGAGSAPFVLESRCHWISARLI